MNKVYVYNPGKAPICGHWQIPAQSYIVVSADEAQLIKQSGHRVQVEGDSDFPEPFIRYNS